MAAPDAELLRSYRNDLNGATRFIPTWVKVAVAIALGLGTMVGWKRIVVTVGEKIGKATSPTRKGRRHPARRQLVLAFLAAVLRDTVQKG